MFGGLIIISVIAYLIYYNCMKERRLKALMVPVLVAKGVSVVSMTLSTGLSVEIFFLQF